MMKIVSSDYMLQWLSRISASLLLRPPKERLGYPPFSCGAVEPVQVERCGTSTWGHQEAEQRCSSTEAHVAGGVKLSNYGGIKLTT
jgi:hypothetical protein